MVIVFSEILFSDTPKFSDRMDNLTVTVGRDAILECVVESLSTYKASSYNLLNIIAVLSLECYLSIIIVYRCCMTMCLDTSKYYENKNNKKI